MYKRRERVKQNMEKIDRESVLREVVDVKAKVQEKRASKVEHGEKGQIECAKRGGGG